MADDVETAFNGSSVDEAYDFFKLQLRSPDCYGTRTRFSYFTFLVVDEECLQTQPYTCVVCSDAPDFGEAEDEIKLKQIRMDFEDVAQYLPALEELILTPDEFCDKEEQLLFNIMPPPTMMFTEEKDVYKLAPGMEARRTKRRALQIIEQAIINQAREARQDKGARRQKLNVQQSLTTEARVEEEISKASPSRPMEPKEPTHDQVERNSTDSRIEPAKEDFTIIAQLKTSYVERAKLNRTLRIHSYRMYQEKGKGTTIKLIDNRKVKSREDEEAYKRSVITGRARPVYSWYRRVYGPIVEGKERPVIVSRGRDVQLVPREVENPEEKSDDEASTAAREE